MRTSPRVSHRLRLTPFLDNLEPRALLSGMHPVAAEVSMMGRALRRPAVVTQLPGANPITASTVPANGDVNPYGTAFVPNGFPGGGPLNPGDLLVSNFNNSANLQGTGTTIVKVSPNGTQSLFFQGPSGLGLTTALGVLRSGYVLVGNVPTTDGTSATVQQGSLLILDRFGHEVANLTNSTFLNGPWDLTVNDRGNNPQVFVSNVLSGTVTRIDLRVTHHGQQIQVRDMVQVASGYTHRTDPAALVVGPTGLAFDPARNILYIASTGDNAIFGIHGASTTRRDQGMGHLVYRDDAHLRGPLGLVLAPNGNLITSNGDAVNPDPNNIQNSELIEFTRHGQFVGQFQVDPAAGGAFGIAMRNVGRNAILAAVNDVTSTVTLYQVRR